MTYEESPKKTATLAEITIIRHDSNGAQPPYIDIVRIPAEYIEKDRSGSAAMQYLEDALAEYSKEHSDTDRIPIWNDLFSLPEDYPHPPVPVQCRQRG